MKKIVIAGVSTYGLNNLSDDAMFAVFTRELHKNIPDLEITLLARHPNKELDNFYKVKSIKNLDHNCREESKGRYFNGLNPDDSSKHLVKIWDAIKNCDLLVIGGEPFIDISIGVYKGLIPYASLLITIAKFLNKPVMIQGIHIGRLLKTQRAKELTKYCITNANIVTIREENTRPILESMGIKTKNLQSKNLIGVTFRHMYWKWNKETWESYSSKVAGICDFMIRKFDSDILFIPHNTYDIDDKYMNDIPAHKDIVTKINNKGKVHQIKNRYNIYETLSLFPLLKMTFSNRRHTLIFGAIHGVPGMGVGEKLHVKVTMEELGIGGDKFVDIKQLDFEKIKQNLVSIWDSRQEIIQKEIIALPKLRDKALKHAQIAKEIVLKNKTNTKKG